MAYRGKSVQDEANRKMREDPRLADTGGQQSSITISKGKSHA